MLISIWSGVDAQCSPRSHLGHRNLLTPSHNARCRDSTKGPLRVVTEPIQMATLGGGHRTRTLWQPLGAVTGTCQIARGDLHNLIGDPDACLELSTTMIELRSTTNHLGRPSTQEEQAQGYQEPKSNK